MAARTLLTEPRSAGNEETWSTLVAKSFPKTTSSFLRWRRSQCWRAPPRPGTETPPRDARTISTPSRCSSMSSAHAVPYRTPAVTVNGSRTCSSLSIPTPKGRISDEARRQTERVPAVVLAALPAVESHSTARKMSTGVRRHDMENTHHCRDYATVEAAVGGGQPRGEAVSDRRTRKSGARRTESTTAARDGQLARYH